MPLAQVKQTVSNCGMTQRVLSRQYGVYAQPSCFDNIGIEAGVFNHAQRFGQKADANVMPVGLQVARLIDAQQACQLNVVTGLLQRLAARCLLQVFAKLHVACRLIPDAAAVFHFIDHQYSVMLVRHHDGDREVRVGCHCRYCLIVWVSPPLKNGISSRS
jgi:hypothetical protein